MNDEELRAGLAPTPGYRYAEVVGDRLFVAGQVPHDGEARLVGAGDVVAQAQQCFANLRALIAVHGFAWTDIRHLTVHVVGTNDDLTAAWSVVTAAFDGDVPPATLLGAALLGHRGQVVELDAHIERPSRGT